MNKPFVVTSSERAWMGYEVMAVLRQCRGQGNAIRGSELAARLKQRDDRKIRVVIDALIAEDIPIASSVSEPYGYYIIANEHEGLKYVQSLESRRDEIQNRIDNFRKAAEKYFTLPQQMQMV